jgi:hypothetical protein
MGYRFRGVARPIRGLLGLRFYGAGVATPAHFYFTNQVKDRRFLQMYQKADIQIAINRYYMSVAEIKLHWNIAAEWLAFLLRMGED